MAMDMAIALEWFSDRNSDGHGNGSGGGGNGNGIRSGLNLGVRSLLPLLLTKLVERRS